MFVQKGVINFVARTLNEFSMGTKENQSFLPATVQPNAITSARYDYSQMQKDFMYHFIDKMNVHMTKDPNFGRDLFGHLVIEMDLKDICKGTNYTQMLDAIKDLQKKPIQYHYDRQNSTYDVTTTLIATLVHKRGTGKIFITTTEASMPVISYLGAGFTSFSKAIAIALPSYYAKRMYELCCRWKDKGFYRTTIVEFRKMMMVEDKFKKITDMTTNVLDRSAKMLSEYADYTFTYTLRKENKSKAFNWLEVNIYPTAGEAGNTNAWYISLYNTMYLIYHDSTAMHVCDWVSEHGMLKKAAERFIRLQKDIDSGKIKGHGLLAYVNKVLEDEFEVPENITFSKAEKLKRERKKNVAAKKAFDAQKTKLAAEAAKPKNKPGTTREIIAGFFNAGETQDTAAEQERQKRVKEVRDRYK